MSSSPEWRAMAHVDGVTGGFPHAPIVAAVAHVLTGERRAAHISITFLSPHGMRKLNRQTFGRDYPTDVIAFPLPHHDGVLIGDVYLCRSVAARSARGHGCSVRNEVLRLAIHGTLHVLGWEHPEGPSRLTSPMWACQERYLAELPC